MVSWLIELRNRSTAVRAAVLATVMLLAFAAVSLVAVRYGDRGTLAAVSVAAFLCWTGASSALVAGESLRGPRYALYAMLTGMFVRMGIPLAFGLAIHLRGGLLVEAGFLYYLAFFYLVSLAVEIWLSLPTSQRGPNTPPAAEV